MCFPAEPAFWAGDEEAGGKMTLPDIKLQNVVRGGA